MQPMLRRLIGEEIAFDVLIDDGKPPIRIDPGQLEQVIMNLVVNARDALLTAQRGHMGTGVALTIEVGARFGAEAPPLAREAVAPSGVVELTVCDTGHGMTDAVCDRLFEPFFTTKA